MFAQSQHAVYELGSVLLPLSHSVSDTGRSVCCAKLTKSLLSSHLILNEACSGLQHCICMFRLCHLVIYWTFKQLSCDTFFVLAQNAFPPAAP